MVDLFWVFRIHCFAQFSSDCFCLFLVQWDFIVLKTWFELSSIFSPLWVCFRLLVLFVFLVSRTLVFTVCCICPFIQEKVVEHSNMLHIFVKPLGDLWLLMKSVITEIIEILTGKNYWQHLSYKSCIHLTW